jgi:hypothetical protein
MQEVEGEVFACNVGARVITVQQPGSTPFHHNLHLIKEDIIRSFESAAPSAEHDSELPVVDEQRSRVREARAVRAAQLEAAKIGVGVTPDAQKIFDALAKTLPCRWDGTVIVVLEEVGGSGCALYVRACRSVGWLAGGSLPRILFTRRFSSRSLTARRTARASTPKTLPLWIG